MKMIIRLRMKMIISINHNDESNKQNNDYKEIENDYINKNNRDNGN